MKILIVEDDLIKMNSIKSFISEFNKYILIEDKMSYQSGLYAVLNNDFDLILLDMQLPNYDIKSGEDGYRPRPVAGRDILREIKRKQIKSSVIIITQYEGWGENGKLESLQNWDKKLKLEFTSSYLQTIQYKPGSNSWKEQLTKHLKRLTID